MRSTIGATHSVLEFFDKHPEVLTAALANAHKFVPERVFTMGESKGGGLSGAAAILGDLLGGASKPVPVPQTDKK